MTTIQHFSHIPKYYQLIQIIKEKIIKRNLKQGDRIDSVRTLEAKYDVSNSVTQKAISKLVNDGIIYCDQGRGTFVKNIDTLKKAEKLNRPKIIGLIVPDITVSFFPEIARGVEDVSHKNDFEVVLCNSDEDPKKEERYIYKFCKRGASGIVMVTGINSFKNKYIKQLNNRMPFVIVDSYIDGIKADCVVNDNLVGAYKVVKHLIKLGHNKIAHISGPANFYTAQERMKGYKKALLDHNINIDETLIKETDFKENSGYEAMKIFLKMKNKPTAIFTANDPLAWGAFKAIKETGLKVPEDMVLVGFADLKQSAFLEVPLTTVRQPSYDMGKKAAETLIEKIKGKRDEHVTKKVVVKTKLVIRQSCGYNMKQTKMISGGSIK